MIIQEKWYGRLGNNIIQLVNILHIALYYKYHIKLLKHSLINTAYIVDYINKTIYKNINSAIVTDSFNFFYRDKIKNINLEAFDKNKDIVYNILKNALIIKSNDVNPLSENDIVIHIRSGDIFSSRPHPMYIPPPLSFYQKIIDNNNFTNIIIICEDKINPVVNKLLELYPNSIYNKNTLIEDIKIILSAKQIICSVGTFIPALCLLSNNIKIIYNCLNNYIDDKIFIYTDLPITNLYTKELNNYYKQMTPWKNNKIQRRLMLNYDINEQKNQILTKKRCKVQHIYHIIMVIIIIIIIIIIIKLFF